MAGPGGTINLTNGDDVFPGPGDDNSLGERVNGLGGNDTIDGGVGNDALNGGAHNDRLTGGLGNDALTGGTGNDTAIFDISTDGRDTANLGAGADRVEASGAPQIRLAFTSSEVGNGDAFDSDTMPPNQDGFLAVRMRAEDGAGGLRGAESRFDDEGISFVAAAGTTFDVRDLVSGARRGDQFNVVTLGTGVSDAIIPGAGTLNHYVNAGMGNDIIVTGAGNDFLVGGAGNDSLDGGEGNDGFIGGGGNDTIVGGAGRDTATIDVSTGGADAVDLGFDTDVVNVSGAAQVRLTFTSAEVGNGAANDSNTMPPNQDGGLAVRMQAEDGSDALVGPVSRLDDEGIVFVASGATTFDVRDLVSGVQRGDDFEVVVLGTTGADALTAVQALRPYYFNAGMGNDSVTGGQADDFLVGGAGNDSLGGGSGNDTFIGGGGDDSLRGGAGNDTLNDDAGADILYGEAGDDRLSSGGANDRLYGGAGNDQLFGGAGDDTLFGESGVDRVDGGDGADRVYADGSADTFVFGDDIGGTDRVSGFQSGVHTLEVSAAGFGGVAGAFAFVSGATPAPGSAQQTFVYDTDDGRLFFDADGNGAGLQTLVAQLFAPGGGAPTLAASDIDLV